MNDGEATNTDTPLTATATPHGGTPSPGAVGRRLPSPKAKRNAIMVMLAVALTIASGACGSSGDETKASTPSEARRTTTTKAESEGERAQRLLAEQCRTQYAVPIEVRPSQMLPSTSSAETTVYFFEIYARDTGAFLSNRATWTIRGDVETYGCG